LATRTGTSLPLVLPVPSWPLLLFPQQYAFPFVVRAQVKCPPLLIDPKLWLVVTPSGLRLHEITTPVSVVHVSVDSTPSSLLPFCPQHHATFPVLIPHVCSLPALNVVNMTPPTT